MSRSARQRHPSRGRGMFTVDAYPKTGGLPKRYYVIAHSATEAQQVAKRWDSDYGPKEAKRYQVPDFAEVVYEEHVPKLTSKRPYR